MNFCRLAAALSLTFGGEAIAQTSFSNNSITAPAATNDDQPVTLGSRFYSDVAGTVTASRFYKGSDNLGTHVGALWSNSGVNLAKVTFSGEMRGGWQQANPSSPVSIAPNTVYIVSYLAPRRAYACDQYYSWST